MAQKIELIMIVFFLPNSLLSVIRPPTGPLGNCIIAKIIN